MNVVREDVEKLVDKELEAATERFGLHHSHHEKYAVINEEYDEACEESRILGNAISHLWAQVKANDAENDINTTYDAMYQFAVNLSCEAIQVAAMCKKEIDERADNGTAEISDHGTYTGKDDVRILRCDACKNDFVSTIRPHPYFCPKCGAEFTNVLRF